jgi:hypothetical protein
MTSNLSLPAKVSLFVSSYLPLLFIFYLQNLKDNIVLAIIFLVLGLVATCVIACIIYYINTTSPVYEKIAKVERKDTEVIAYLFTYIFPFLQLNFTDVINLISLGIFFVILGIIYINSSMICINPTLSLIGYHLYEIENSEGNSHMLLSRNKRVVKNTELTVVTLGEDIIVVKENAVKNP